MGTNVKQDTLDDYNPFADPPAGDRYGVPTTVVVPDEPPPYSADLQKTTAVSIQTPASQSTMSADAILALERRQAELEARAAELDRREKEQQARMAAYQTGPAPENWPPLPSWCPCKPCVRQDFEVEIPLDCRWMAKMGYGLWIAYTLVLLINMGSALAYFIVGTSTVEAPLFGVSILIFLVFPPLSFFCWYRPLYKALRSDKSLYYFCFFAAFTAQGIISLIQCVGLDYFGACGFINGAKMCSKSRPVCLYMITVAGLFCAFTVCCAFLIFKVHRHFRHSDASARKAKLELTTAAALEASSSFGAMP